MDRVKTTGPVIGIDKDGQPLRGKTHVLQTQGWMDVPLPSVDPTPIEPPTEPDDVNHPVHYTQHVLPNGTPIECIDVLDALCPHFHIANCIKYLWRAPYHPGGELKSLKKARWYLDRRITALENAR